MCRAKVSYRGEIELENDESVRKAVVDGGERGEGTGQIESRRERDWRIYTEE